MTPDEIVRVFDEHMDRHRPGYTQGSGVQLFAILRSEIARTLQAKHPRAPEPEPDAERASGVRLRRSRRRFLHNASGVADVFVGDRRADRMFRDRDQASPVELRSNLGGYEGAGEPIGLEDDAGEDALSTPRRGPQS